MKIYIASSWRNVHAVELLTAELRKLGHEVFSFVENNFYELEVAKKIGFDEWVNSEGGSKAFDFDVSGAIHSDLVIYISPSGKDAAAEVGAAWASGVTIFGLYAKGEDFGLMRRMVSKWFDRYPDLIQFITKK
ncbi:MAG: hypothetical protein WC389_17135 [Lutibacter sp.]|jgi:hypothetical protein